MTDLRSPATDNGMEWSVYGRFIVYVLSTAAGRYTATGGSRVISPGTFHFGLLDADDFDPTKSSGTLRLTGDVRLSGHSGMLLVQIAQPEIRFSDGEATLTIAGQVEGGRQPLARLNFTGASAASVDGVTTWSNVQTRLDTKGTSVFNDVYPPDTPLDPLTLRY